jgi:serine/threonine-protein kinase
VLADTYLLLGVYGFKRPRDVFPGALATARKAVSLDEKLAGAHSTLGWGIQLLDLDREGAEREFKRALELSPGDVPTHLRYGTYLIGLRRIEEGLEMLRRGVELDPLSMVMRAICAYGYYLARRYREAEQLCKATLELEPNYWWTHWSLAETYRATTRPDEAIVHLEIARALSPANAFIEGSLGAAYAAGGRDREAAQLLADMRERSARQYVAPYFMSLVQLGLRDTEGAFESLFKAAEERDSWISFCAVNPALDELRSDARFDELTRRMNVDW